MLGNEYFGFNILRKLDVTLGTLINNVKVQRYDANGTPHELIRVPLEWSAKPKTLQRAVGDPDIDKKTAITLPRMGYYRTGMSYDSGRAMRASERFFVEVDSANTGKIREQLTPSPWNIKYSVWWGAEYQSDANKIAEQVLPFFKPHFPTTIEIVPDQPTVDIPWIMQSVNWMDSYEGDPNQRRSIIWEMELLCQAYLFGPIRSHPVIKFAKVDLYNATLADPITDAIGNTQMRIDRVTVQPGLDANGNPTSNVEITIPYSQISADDPWDYAVYIAGNLSAPEGVGGEEY